MDLEEQYDRLLKYCYAKVNNRDLAEDITQEAFLKFWQTKNYQSLGKEMAYLYTIARNLCLDYFKRKKEELPGDDELFDAVIDEKTKVEDEVLNSILLKQALSKLSVQDREIIMLHFISELSVTDIGKILGISRFAVHRRLKTAKEILKREMEGQQ